MAKSPLAPSVAATSISSPDGPPSAVQPVTLRTLTALLLGLAFVLFGTYSIIGMRQAAVAVHTLATPIDDLITFSAPWVVIYFGLYPILFAPMVTIVDRRVAVRTCIGMSLLVLICAPFWLLWPVTVPRTPLDVVDPWTWGLHVIRALDPPTNCLPSMHVAGSTFAALCVWRHDKWPGTGTMLLAMGIWYASVAVDQHWFVDGLAGAGLALAIDRFIYRGVPTAAFVPRDRRGHWLWLGLYAALLAVMVATFAMGLHETSTLDPTW
ncbi:MAG: phosphatase PAP2 family protein [Myxococcales bacterium]|nr:phosphatase PAP2 family protein [Myxococcales bacterium]